MIKTNMNYDWINLSVEVNMKENYDKRCKLFLQKNKQSYSKQKLYISKLYKLRKLKIYCFIIFSW